MNGARLVTAAGCPAVETVTVHTVQVYSAAASLWPSHAVKQ